MVAGEGFEPAVRNPQSTENRRFLGYCLSKWNKFWNKWNKRMVPVAGDHPLVVKSGGV